MYKLFAFVLVFFFLSRSFANEKNPFDIINDELDSRSNMEDRESNFENTEQKEEDEYDFTTSDDYQNNNNANDANSDNILKNFGTIQSNSLGHVAVISCLNKVTAKSQQIRIKKGESEIFGNLEIKVLKCINENSTAAIFLDVTEHKLYDDDNSIFKGWLISSNPSVSTLYHPVYEIFAISCDKI